MQGSADALALIRGFTGIALLGLQTNWGRCRRFLFEGPLPARTRAASASRVRLYTMVSHVPAAQAGPDSGRRQGPECSRATSLALGHLA